MRITPYTLLISLILFTCTIDLFLYINKGDFSLSLTSYLDLSFYSLFCSLSLYVYCILIFLFINTYYSKLFVKLPKLFPVLRTSEIVDRYYINCFTLILFLISIFRIKNIYDIGIVSYMSGTRAGEFEVGGLNYILLMGLPLLLLSDYINENLRKLVFIALIVLNLITGFRLLLIWAILLFLIKSSLSQLLILTKRAFIILLILIVLFIFYGFYRASVELPILSELKFSDKFNLILDSLNRTNPVTLLAYLNDKNINFVWHDFFNFLFQPVFSFLNYFLGLNLTASYEISVFSETIFRDYLVQRGTPDQYATGFSVGMIPVLYAHFGIILTSLIIFVIAIIFQSIIKMATVTYDFYNKSFLIIIVSFIIASFLESFSVAIGLLEYSIIFLVSVYFLRTILLALFSFKRSHN